MWSVAYSYSRVIMLCALSLKLMYRYFNKPYAVMLHAVLFSLLQYASTIVTYMIVLLQFDKSDKSHYECSRNVTAWVTWRLELICAMWPTKMHNLFSLTSLLLLLIFITKSTFTATQASPCCKWRSSFLRDRLNMWQNRPVGASGQIWIIWPIVRRQCAAW